MGLLGMLEVACEENIIELVVYAPRFNLPTESLPGRKNHHQFLVFLLGKRTHRTRRNTQPEIIGPISYSFCLAN